MINMVVKHSFEKKLGVGKNMRMKKSKQIGIRLNESEWQKLVDVQENIALVSRGQKPEISEIVRSIIGFGNPGLVSSEEREYLAGKRDSIHGPGAKRDKP